MSQYRAIRGMVDVLPDETPLWQMLEQTARDVLAAHGYAEIRTPIVESTELFARAIGAVTDIVEKEMYSFTDRNDESISLRPEGTASTVRAAIQCNLIQSPQRVWYMGPMFRYERPQKGRQRQFHQLGVETFGIAGPEQDAELLLLCRQWWTGLGINDVLTLELNTIGSPEARASYKAALTDYLRAHFHSLDEDSQRRLDTNPLRTLDSKSATTQAILDGAPSMAEYLDEESRRHHERLCQLLDTAGLAYNINPRLVRGLDYYNKTVFEWTTDRLGTQAAVCGGGRYDMMVSQFGGKATPASGFAAGLDRLVLLMRTLDVDAIVAPDLYIVSSDEKAFGQAMLEADRIRAEFPGLTVVQHLGGGSFKSQFKRADKSGAAWAMVFGAEEMVSGKMTLKPLRVDEEQMTLSREELDTFLRQLEQLTNKY